MGRFRKPRDLKTHQFRFNNEQDVVDIELFKDIYEEAVHLYGSDLIYIRKENFRVEDVFGEHLSQVLEQAVPVRAFVEQQEGWDGMGNLYSKFGLRNQDEMTVHLSKGMFQDLGIVPKNGDLIYHVVSARLWEIENVRDDIVPTFHPLGKHVSYVLGCHTYVHDHADAAEAIMDSTNEHVQNIVQTLFSDSTDSMPIKEPIIRNEPIKSESDKVMDRSECDPLGFMDT